MPSASKGGRFAAYLDRRSKNSEKAKLEFDQVHIGKVTAGMLSLKPRNESNATDNNDEQEEGEYVPLARRPENENAPWSRIR